MSHATARSLAGGQADNRADCLRQMEHEQLIGRTLVARGQRPADEENVVANDVAAETVSSVRH
jgi:hypothetical protein